jgi:hypothetical protein
MPSISTEIDSGESKEGGKGLMPPPPSTPPAGKISPARLLKVREGSNKIVMNNTEESKQTTGMNSNTSSSLAHHTVANTSSNIASISSVQSEIVIDSSGKAPLKKGGVRHNFFRGTVRKVDLPEKKIIARDWKGIGKPSSATESKEKDGLSTSKVVDDLEFDEHIQNEGSSAGKLSSTEEDGSFDDVIRVKDTHDDEPQYKMALNYVSKEGRASPSSKGKMPAPAVLSATDKKLRDIKSLLLDNSDLEERLNRVENKSESTEANVVKVVIGSVTSSEEAKGEGASSLASDEKIKRRASSIKVESNSENKVSDNLSVTPQVHNESYESTYIDSSKKQESKETTHETLGLITIDDLNAESVTYNSSSQHDSLMNTPIKRLSVSKQPLSSASNEHKGNFLFFLLYNLDSSDE